MSHWELEGVATVCALRNWSKYCWLSCCEQFWGRNFRVKWRSIRRCRGDFIHWGLELGSSSIGRASQLMLALPSLSCYHWWVQACERLRSSHSAFMTFWTSRQIHRPVFSWHLWLSSLGQWTSSCVRTRSSCCHSDWSALSHRLGKHKCWQSCQSQFSSCLKFSRRLGGYSWGTDRHRVTHSE